jgi:hypothetical protein
MDFNQRYDAKAHQYHKVVKGKKTIDNYYTCSKHGTKWWPGQYGPHPCQGCFSECWKEARMEAWEKRRGQHAVVSDLPFTERKP